MLRWQPLLLGALALSSPSWSGVAHAQSDSALPDAPAPLPPPETEPPAPPPTPAPVPPGSESPPSTAPVVPSGPPSSAFPAPASPDADEPSTRAEPVPSVPPPEPAPPARPQRPSEGLFEERRPLAPVHHHEDDGKKERTDQFKIGPVVGVGVPSVLSFGATLKVTRYLGAGINVGLIPKVRLNYYGDATLSYQHYDIYGRIYPFGGGFFLSGGAGYATVDGTLTASETRSVSGVSGTVDYQGKGSVRTLMLTALIGYFYTTSIGFSIGVDAGAQIPLAPSQIEFSRNYSVSAPAPIRAQAESALLPYVTQSDESIRDSLEKIGRSVLPTLNLRIGWIL